MKRIVLLLSISVLATVILAIVHLAEAQQGTKIYRIGYLSTRTQHGGHGPYPKAFRQGLRELGYIGRPKHRR